MRIGQAALIVSALILAGCAAKVIASGPRTVLVNAGSADPGGAMQLATAECAKNGLHPRLSARPTEETPRQWAFDCVP